MLSFVLAVLLMIGAPLTNDEKEAWGFVQCEDVADMTGYDECAVELSADGARMWLHYGCARWDPEIENWRINFDTVVAYRWTDLGVMKMDNPVLVGCPVVL